MEDGNSEAIDYVPGTTLVNAKRLFVSEFHRWLNGLSEQGMRDERYLIEALCQTMSEKFWTPAELTEGAMLQMTPSQVEEAIESTRSEVLSHGGRFTIHRIEELDSNRVVCRWILNKRTRELMIEILRDGSILLTGSTWNLLAFGPVTLRSGIIGWSEDAM